MNFIQANTNGRLHPATEPSITPLNRGFLYGDAIYEVWRTYKGVIFAWEEHWNRLLASAKALYFELPFTQAQVLVEIRRTVAAFQSAVKESGDLYIRLQVTRGGGAIGLDTGLADQADFLLLVQFNKPLSEAKYREGLTLSLATSLHRNAVETLNPAWKTGNYLNNILCLREARARGADEVMITNLRGEITEAAVSNLAFVRDGVLVTPPLDAGILAGITRAFLLNDIAPAAGVKVSEEVIRPEHLPQMQECIMMSTTKDLVPIRAVDQLTFKVGEDTVTARLKKAFTEYMQAYATARESELKV